LRAVERGAPTFDGVMREHAAYIRALEEAGVAVEVLSALPAHPDSIFVEDTALIFHDTAIVLRPGAPTRTGEAAEIARVLEHRFEHVLHLRDSYVDGGDVLATPKTVFIGLSQRTTAEGARALVGLLDQIGLRGVVVSTPRDVLHLKSDCSLLDDETVFATERLAATDIFDAFHVVRVPETEEGAANAIRVNDRVLISDGYPRSADLLGRLGFSTVPLATREVAKIDAGLSCMSLRWRA
jgi:dimethylargininase